MMRVTVEDGTDEIVLKIEGKLVDPMTAELEAAWRPVDPRGKKVRLDITGLTFVDETGKQILRAIAAATNADIRADSPLTKHFAREISGSSATPGGINP